MKEKIMYSSLWIQVLLCLSVATIESQEGGAPTPHPLCFYLKTQHIRQINVTVGSLLDANSTEQCGRPTDSCYMLWQEDPRNGSVTVISQGCWNDGNQKCLRNECVPEGGSPRARDNTHFCCCFGNFCNANASDPRGVPEVHKEEPNIHFLGKMSYTMHVVVVFVGLILLSAIVGTIYTVHRMYCIPLKRGNESLHLMEAPPPLQNIDLDTLELKESLGRGRYGSVFRGTLSKEDVAVKIFSYHHRRHFLNEQAIYILPHMDHPSLPNFIGYKERQGESGNPPDFLLVLSYSPVGCLKDYLKENTVDWNGLCKMSLSVASGLAHLHSEIRKGNKIKPCIVHRDVTSRNILVKEDGTCMLCDFGFAIQISGAKYVLNGQEVKAEEASLSDVGTLRYMAPEILEGAVNLRDCESSLKQTDVYALGLVMWEIASRCSDLYQGVEVPEYKLPYEAEIGTEPTMEQMQTLVARRKTRPLFPDNWKTSNPAIRSLKESIEECWDQDSEARLTSLCVEERITELPVLWEWHRAGLNFPGSMSPSLNSVSNLLKSVHNKSNDSDFGSESTDEQLISTSCERINSLSEGTTETMLSPSDANNQANEKNQLNKNSPASKVTYPIQPFHGRNPCLARNLMQESADDTFTIDNACPTKYPISNKMLSHSDGDANIFSLPPDVESNLIPRESANRICNPIPYVQNQVSGAPNKQSNLHSAKSNQKPNFFKEGKRWDPLGMLAKKKDSFLRVLLDRKSSASSGCIPEEQQPLKSAVSSPISPSDGHGQTNPAGAFWPSPDEQDRYSSLDTVVVSDKSSMGSKPLSKSQDSGCFFNGSILTGSEENNCASLLGNLNDEKPARPATLPVRSLSDLRAPDPESVRPGLESDRTGPIRRGSSSGRKRGVRRVKTPFEIKGRLSLYDDRIMTSQDLPAVPSADKDEESQAKFSLSVPLNMNAMCASPPHADGAGTQDGAVAMAPDDSPHCAVPLCDV